MIRSIRIALAIAAVAAAAVAVSAPALAAAPAPKGALTAAEYAELNTEQATFKKLEHDKRLTWDALYAVCNKVGRSTALLQSVRLNCDTGVGFDQSLGGFYADAQRCSALETTTTTTTTTTPGTTTTGTTTTGTTTTGTTTTGTTTTGTTTTGTTLTPAELKLYACLEPEYAAIGRAANSIFHTQSALRAQVLARRFVGRCRLTLGPTVQQLHALNRFAGTAKQLDVDVKLITKVANGQAPSSAINDSQLVRNAVAFSDAARAFAKLHRPQKLSVCPHQ